MNPDRFAAVRELFDRVIELPGGEREPALRSWSSDPDLIADVLALCRAINANSTAQFAGPLNAVLQSATMPNPKSGNTLGVWRIVREIGHGGMGSVFMVERTDGHFTQTAALKFVKGVPRTDSLAYFTRERQLLATLKHPNIARLLDGGATQEGQPYLVMEYVDGLPIDEYCRHHRLNTAAILSLFTTACAAVGFSHRQLIVHCDLKPSNLLIESEGRPVLLDFGIAKLLDRVGRAEMDVADFVSIGDPVAGSERSAGSGSNATATNATANMARAMPFTPRYASPEQRELGVVTTASDIYSLGVLLRELLGAAPDRESRASGPATLRQRELAAILDRATHADPARRYPSVDALTDDIHHYLRHQPVRAMPAARLYTTRKLLARRRPVAVAAAVFLLTILGFTAKVAVESRRALAAERLAVSERDATRAAEADAVRARDGAEAARKEAVLERDRAALAETAAAAQRNVALTAQAAATTERDRARQAERTAVEERNRAALAETSARQTNYFLVSIFGGNSNAQSGDIPVSKLIAAAETRLEKELSGQPAIQAELYSAMAQVQFSMGRNKESVANFERAIELERKQQRPLVLAQMLARYAHTDLYAFGSKRAVALAREALELRERHARADSEEVADSLAVYGTALFVGNGEIRESGEVLRRSLAIREKLDPGGAGAAQSLWYLASHAELDGRYEDAFAFNRRALAIREKLFGADHPASLDVRDTLAWALHRSRHSQEAEAITRGTLAVRERLYGPQSQPVLRNMVILGSVLGGMGRVHEQLEINLAALTLAEKAPVRDAQLYAGLLNNVALGQAALGRSAEAVRRMEELMPIARDLWPPLSPPMCTIERNFGITLRKAGRLRESAVQLAKAHEVSLAVRGKAHQEVADILAELALTYALDGKLDEAAGRLEQANGVTSLQKHPSIHATYLQAAATISAKRGRTADALAGYQRAEQVLAEAYGEKDIRSGLALVYRADLLARGDAAADRAESRELARRILANVGDKLASDAPVLLHVQELQRP